jgi:hypothetical protein
MWVGERAKTVVIIGELSIPIFNLVRLADKDPGLVPQYKGPRGKVVC